MLDSAYQASTDAALNDLAQRQPTPTKQAPAFSFWGLMAAPAKGGMSGVAQAAGSLADVNNAFGSVLGSMSDAGSAGMFGGLSDKERQETNAAQQKLINNGPDYNSEAGRSLRNVGKDYLPDPLTSHASEVTVANLGRVLVKAVAAGATLGPIAGAGVAGAEEGFSTADDLGQQGVDLGTRTIVGGITAAVNAVGFGLPVAGKTIAGTVGLALAGGPASFYIQNDATRAVLKAANYSKLADQYDPLDPVGLTLSTLLPLGFGALALRNARRVDRVAPEAVDAARVAVQKEHIDSVRPVAAEDLAGAAAHSKSMERALDQLATGERVDVSDIAPTGAAQVVTQAMHERLQPVVKSFEEEQALRAAAETPAPVQTAGPLRLDLETPEGGRNYAILDDAGKEVGAVSLTEKSDRLKLRTIGIDDAQARGKGLGIAAYEQIIKEGLSRGKFFESDGEVSASAQRIYQALEKRGYKVERNSKAKLEEDGTLSTKGWGIYRVTEAPQLRAKPPRAEPSKAAGEGSFKTESPEMDRAVGELEATSPDLMVHLDGMAEPMQLADLMAQVREEAKADAAEAPLIEAAANCFIRGG